MRLLGGRKSPKAPSRQLKVFKPKRVWPIARIVIRRFKSGRALYLRMTAERAQSVVLLLFCGNPKLFGRPALDLAKHYF